MIDPDWVMIESGLNSFGSHVDQDWIHDESRSKSWLIWINNLSINLSGMKSWLIGFQVMIDRKWGHDLIWLEVIIYPNGSHDWSDNEVTIYSEWSYDWSGMRSWFNLVWSDYLSVRKSWFIRMEVMIQFGLKWLFIRTEVWFILMDVMIQFGLKWLFIRTELDSYWWMSWLIRIEVLIDLEWSNDPSRMKY